MRSESDLACRLHLGMIAGAVLVLLLAAGAPFAEDHPDFRVVVNAANRVESLDAEQVSRLFLKKVTKWEDGLPVLPVDQSEDSTVRAAFTQQIHRRKIAAVKAYWQQRIFSGRDLPPPVRDSDEEVIRYVEANPGAVGYVSGACALREKVRVIALSGATK